jgi:hypothetical protein
MKRMVAVFFVALGIGAILSPRNAFADRLPLRELQRVEVDGDPIEPDGTTRVLDTRLFDTGARREIRGTVPQASSTWCGLLRSAMLRSSFLLRLMRGVS